MAGSQIATGGDRIGLRKPAGLLAREVVAPGMFVALVLASNFALADLPNVKLFDLLVFVAGYTLGFRRGVTVAAMAWVLYDTANPWGPASPMLLLTKIAGETVYAIAGAGLRRFVLPDRVKLGPGSLSLVLIGTAFATTLTYDLVTNIYTGFIWAGIAGGTEYTRWLGIALFGQGAVLFMVMHVGSNLVLFPVFGPLLMKGADRTKRALGWA
jgi:hypothetical protein